MFQAFFSLKLLLETSYVRPEGSFQGHPSVWIFVILQYNVQNACLVV
jgi:hypothetical protein